jgi:hypothetical protein
MDHEQQQQPAEPEDGFEDVYGEMPATEGDYQMSTRPGVVSSES